METSFKPPLHLLFCVSILTSLLLPVSSYRPLPEAPTAPSAAECTNLLPHNQAIVLNSVFIPPNATRTVPITSPSPFTTTVTLTFTLVNTQPLNPVYNSVPMEVTLVLGRRSRQTPLLLGLRSSCGEVGGGGEGGNVDVDVWMLKPSSSLGRHVWEVVVRAARFWSLVLTSVLMNVQPRDYI